MPLIARASFWPIVLLVAEVTGMDCRVSLQALVRAVGVGCDPGCWARTVAPEI